MLHIQLVLESFDMRTCPLLLLSLWYCYATLVVEVPFDENDLDQKTTLTFNDDIEISNPMTFCIRFNLKDYVSPRYILSIQQKVFELKVGDTGMGRVKIHGHNFNFKIPKSGLQPFSWTHFCFCSYGEHYQVVVNGVQWHEGKSTIFEKVKVHQFILGSTLGYHNYYSDFKGEITDLNIWNKRLSSKVLKNITENCGVPEPIPDTLFWSNLDKSMFKGQNIVEETCILNDEKPSTYKILPTQLDHENAMHACKILQAKLAYPKTLQEYKKWSSKFDF